MSRQSWAGDGKKRYYLRFVALSQDPASRHTSSQGAYTSVHGHDVVCCGVDVYVLCVRCWLLCAFKGHSPTSSGQQGCAASGVLDTLKITRGALSAAMHSIVLTIKAHLLNPWHRLSDILHNVAYAFKIAA